MKTNLEKLRELLCTVKEVEKDIKELRFGCEIEVNGYNEKLLRTKNYGHDTYFVLINGRECDMRCVEWEIIGHPLEERHLRMYCESKNIYIKIDFDGTICEWKNLEPVNIIATLDNTKSLENQTEETLGKIFNYFNELIYLSK